MQAITSVIEGWIREYPDQCCGCIALAMSLSSCFHRVHSRLMTRWVPIAGGDDEKLRKHRLVRIDRLVIENFGVDQLLVARLHWHRTENPNSAPRRRADRDN